MSFVFINVQTSELRFCEIRSTSPFLKYFLPLFKGERGARNSFGYSFFVQFAAGFPP